MTETDASGAEPKQEAAHTSGMNWNDPDVPAGNAPPMPAWPLYLWTVAWLASIVFLIVTLITLTRINPI